LDAAREISSRSQDACSSLCHGGVFHNAALEAFADKSVFVVDRFIHITKSINSAREFGSNRVALLKIYLHPRISAAQEWCNKDTIPMHAKTNGTTVSTMVGFPNQRRSYANAQGTRKKMK
jgi:hypothetical protein